MKFELRRIPHADIIPFASTLPRELRRYAKRSERNYMENLAMKEYWQEQAEEL